MTTLPEGTYTVAADVLPSRIDVYIAQRLPAYSRAKIQHALECGDILLNGKEARKRVMVKTGDTITIKATVATDPPGSTVMAEDIPLEILYEDEFIVAVNKPAGLVVHPGNGNPDHTLVNALVHHIPALSNGFSNDRPGIVHRLDKDTSGVLLVAKNDVIHAQLAKLFAQRTIEKYYIGICIGAEPLPHGTINVPLARSRTDPLKRVVRGGGKESLTEYWLLDYRHGAGVIKFRLHTGRTHQIRVHCVHAGFPIIGDELYGHKRAVLIHRMAPLSRPFAYSIVKCFDRQALHAHCVRFTHPVTGKTLQIIAPLSADMQKALALFDPKIEKKISY